MSNLDPTRPAVVLLSGGVDSATCLAIARDAGLTCYCLTFAYGQRHRIELAAARSVAKSLGAASLREIEIDLRAFGGSALTSDAAVPKSDEPFVASRLTGSEIPITYVPARNTIFLSYALALAEVMDAGSIWIGVNAIDYSGYPDCRPEFIRAFQSMADLATRAGVEGHGPRIVTPLLAWTKSRIIRTGIALGVDYAKTLSCYDPVELSDRSWQTCGRCDACRIRAAAFAELGRADPSFSQ